MAPDTVPVAALAFSPSLQQFTVVTSWKACRCVFSIALSLFLSIALLVQANLFLKMASESLENQSLMSITGSYVKILIIYSKWKDLPTGLCIRSPIFTAGGYDWALHYYPQGSEPQNNVSPSLFLVLKSEVEDITAWYQFRIHEKNGNLITPYLPGVEKFTTNRELGGYANFMTKDSIENLYCVKGIFGIYYCNIRILFVTEPRVDKSYPGGLNEHIEKLGEKGEGFDVTFEVEGQSISAHKLILAARSPVFQAKLFSPMAEAKMGRIKIDEMKAEVFKALLYFLYTDKLAICESSDDETHSVELLQELFVAADRYAVEKLTILCEKQLEKNLSVDTVLTTLLLADRHGCAGLKKKCLDFVSDPENLSLVAVTEKYLHVMLGAPLLFSDLIENLKCLSR